MIQVTIVSHCNVTTNNNMTITPYTTYNNKDVSTNKNNITRVDTNNDDTHNTDMLPKEFLPISNKVLSNNSWDNTNSASNNNNIPNRNAHGFATPNNNILMKSLTNLNRYTNANNKNHIDNTLTTSYMGSNNTSTIVSLENKVVKKVRFVLSMVLHL